MIRVYLCAVCAALGIATTMVACHDDAMTDSTAAPVIEPAKDAVAKSTELGPVKATVKVWPAKPSLGDPIYVRLEVDAPVGVSIDAPFQEAGDQRLGRFRVVGFTRDAKRKPDGGEQQLQTYTLEAPSSGRQRIPPFRLEMLDARNKTEKKEPQEILTDEIPIEVTPIKTEAVDAELKPAAGELDPDVGGIGWLTILGIVSGVAIAGSGTVLGFRALRARRRIAQQRSAYDEAVAELRALETQGAPDTDAADAWFVRLSGIVRRYLEQRYSVRAPELTTEEFLLVAAKRAELTSEHRAMLMAFLERCDRVKFAGYRPDAAESLATLKAARGFVEDTRLREVIAGQAAA